MTDIVEFERRIEAAPAVVFRYLVDAALWTQWQGTEAVIEPHAGGVHRVNIRGDGFAAGRIIEIIPDRRLVFTWGFDTPGHPLPAGSTLIEINLEGRGEATVLHFRQSAVPTGFDAVARGWAHYLERLVIVAEGREPGADPHVRT